jgi:hypothetical protein
MLGVVTLLAAMQAPAHAAAPVEAQGHWQYITVLTDVREAGCNTISTLTEEDVLTGTFEGESSGEGVVVAHCSGSFNFKGLLNFEEMTVDGKTGGLTMSVSGRLADPTGEWTGNWFVVSATGELEGLHGQGKWWGPGAGGPGLPGHLDYDGKVHFHPNS